MQYAIAGNLTIKASYSNGTPYTGGNALIWPSIRKDGGAVANLSNITVLELDATKAPGSYGVRYSSTEATANTVDIYACSTTANVVLITPLNIAVLPANITLANISATGNVAMFGNAANITGNAVVNVLGNVANVTGTPNVGNCANITNAGLITIAAVSGAVGSVTGNCANITGTPNVGNAANVTGRPHVQLANANLTNGNLTVDVRQANGTNISAKPGTLPIDWSNITAPTTTVALTGTSIGNCANITGNAVVNVPGFVGGVTANVTFANSTINPSAAAIAAAVGSNTTITSTSANTAAIAGIANQATTVKADAVTFAGQPPVQTAGKLWVLDGSGNPVMPASAYTAPPSTSDITTAITSTFGSGPYTTADVTNLDILLSDVPGLVWDQEMSFHQAGDTAGVWISHPENVWGVPLSGNTTSGSTGEALSAAGGAGDPWITALPGSYVPGQAGYIVGTNLDAQASAIKAKTDHLPSSDIVHTAGKLWALDGSGNPVAAASAITGLQSHGDSTWSTATGFATPTNITAGTLTTVGTVTTLTNLPTIPANWITSAGIAAGAITDAKITVPAETAGRPTGILAMLRRLFEGRHNKRTRNRSTGVVAIRNAADSADLETATQSTSGSTDTITAGG